MNDKPDGNYRDELSAALARSSSLERQLQEANKEISNLKAPPKSKKLIKRRTVRVVPNGRYLPLLGLWMSGIKSARSPRLPRPQDHRYGSVVAAALNAALLVPLGYILKALYFVHLYLLVAPWTLFLSTLLSLPLLVLLILRSIRFSDAPRAKPILRGVKGANYLWTLLSFAGQPLLPLFSFGWEAGASRESSARRPNSEKS